MPSKNVSKTLCDERFNEVQELKDDVKQIMVNHLPHLSEEIAIIKEQNKGMIKRLENIDKKFWAVILLLLGMGVQLLIG